MNKTTITTLAVCALAGFTTHAQNLLQNGSFESPVIPTDTYLYATPASWVWSDTVGVIAHGLPDDVAFTRYGPQDGQQYVDLGNEPLFVFSQAFTITKQGVYVLRWFDSTGDDPFPGLTNSPYSVAILTAAAQTVAGRNLNAYHVPPDTGTWASNSMPIALSPGTYTLRFRAEGVHGGLDSLIDNVSLELAPDSDLVAAIHLSAVDVCWSGRTNQMYQVQYRTNLSGTNWFDFGSPVLGTGTNCVTDGIIGMERRFYRIIRVP